MKPPGAPLHRDRSVGWQTNQWAITRGNRPALPEVIHQIAGSQLGVLTEKSVDLPAAVHFYTDIAWLALTSLAQGLRVGTLLAIGYWRDIQFDHGIFVVMVRGFSRPIHPETPALPKRRWRLHDRWSRSNNDRVHRRNKD